METYNFLITNEHMGERIDKYLFGAMEGQTRSYIQGLADAGNVIVNGKSVKSNYKLKVNDKIDVNIPPPVDLAVEGEEIPLDVVYEDNDMLVINKPQGMVVHPAAGNYSGTLVNALISHCGDSLSGINGVMRPGILHRIDKDTSGLLMVGKNDKAHKCLAEQIKEHSLTREYIALVHGNVKADRGVINAPVGRDVRDRKKMAVTSRNAKEAVTYFEVMERFGRYTLVKCRLKTGRTHQIRVHMSSRGHSVVGDKVYGVKKEEFKLSGQLLHAYRVGFIHPSTGVYMEFSSELPDYFQKVVENLRKM